MKTALAKAHRQDNASVLRVLVIDDDDVAREIIVDVLAREGHNVTSLPSPIGATKHIVEHQIEVVVLDVMMPSMRGDKLAALLGRNPKLKNLGVVLVTSARAEDVSMLADSVSSVTIVTKDGLQADLPQAVRRAAKR
ncbi:MAG TPA: response regulator [Polyangiaceae bacterium]|nr:response regulator [Polyangiaceae bacterium]